MVIMENRITSALKIYIQYEYNIIGMGTSPPPADLLAKIDMVLDRIQKFLYQGFAEKYLLGIIYLHKKT